MSNMLLSTWQPTQTNLFKVFVDGTPAYYLGEDWIASASLPDWTADPVAIEYMNERKYIPGKVKFSPVKITLRDPIVENAAANVRNWLYTCYDPRTGRGNYSALLKKNLTIVQYDPAGNAVREWLLEGSFPMKFTQSELSYDKADLVILTVEISIDKWFLLV